MKKYVLSLFTFLAVITIAGASNNDAYHLDDQQVETLFTEATEIGNLPLLLDPLNSPRQVAGEDDRQMVAGVIAIAEIVTGIGVLIPIHRIYLGLGGAGTKIILAYVCTASGCGIVLLVDAITLLMDAHGTKYIDNPKFIMWN